MAFRTIEVSGDSQPLPMNRPLRPDEATRAVETRVIKVKGILDAGAYEQFAPLLQWVPVGPFEIVIDCHELAQVTTAGFGLFLRADAHARRYFGRVRIVGCNEDVARVLQTATDFTNRFHIPFERASPKL